MHYRTRSLIGWAIAMAFVLIATLIALWSPAAATAMVASAFALFARPVVMEWYEDWRTQRLVRKMNAEEEAAAAAPLPTGAPAPSVPRNRAMSFMGIMLGLMVGVLIGGAAFYLITLVQVDGDIAKTVKLVVASVIGLALAATFTTFGYMLTSAKK